jgi:hypothetical protein
VRSVGGSSKTTRASNTGVWLFSHLVVFLKNTRVVLMSRDWWSFPS